MKIFNWKVRHFLKKKRDVAKLILDLEFKRFKTREIREEIRQERDGLLFKLEQVSSKTKSEADNPNKNIDEFKRLEDEKVILERDIKRLENHMKELDLEIEGSKPTQELPNGLQGINQQIDSLRELELMIRDYIKIL